MIYGLSFANAECLIFERKKKRKNLPYHCFHLGADSNTFFLATKKKWMNFSTFFFGYAYTHAGIHKRSEMINDWTNDTLHASNSVNISNALHIHIQKLNYYLDKVSPTREQAERKKKVGCCCWEKISRISHILLQFNSHIFIFVTYITTKRTDFSDEMSFIIFFFHRRLVLCAILEAKKDWYYVRTNCIWRRNELFNIVFFWRTIIVSQVPKTIKHQRVSRRCHFKLFSVSFQRINDVAIQFVGAHLLYNSFLSLWN